MVTLRIHKRQSHPVETQELVCHVSGFTTVKKFVMGRHYATKHDPEAGHVIGAFISERIVQHLTSGEL